MTPKLPALAGTFSFALFADVASKRWLMGQLAPGEEASVIEGFFTLTHVRNPGAAFGLMSNAPEGIRLPALITLSVLAIALIGIYFWRLPECDGRSALALGLVLGGAIGNLSDRILHGGVMDFLLITVGNRYAWPSFNLADLFVVTGACALIFEHLAAQAAARAR